MALGDSISTEGWCYTDFVVPPRCNNPSSGRGGSRGNGGGEPSVWCETELLFRARSRGPRGRQRRNQRGFTLTELMVVVVIMSVLATIGISSYRRHLARSKNTEALSMLRSIGAAQERFRADTGVYFDVSGSLTDYYPSNTPRGGFQPFWGHAHADSARWAQLAPDAPELVGYSYATTAGLPYSAPGPIDPEIPAGRVQFPNAANITQPWYVVAARGDSDGNQVMNYIVGSSFGPDIFQVKVGE